MSKFTSTFLHYVDAQVRRWNERERGTSGGSKLAFKVTIFDSKFVSGQRRFWSGPLSGSSHMAAKVEFIDQATGAVVARESFHQAAGAMKGMFTIGASDNRMITALAQDTANFIVNAFTFRPEGGVIAEQADSQSDAIEDPDENESGSDSTSDRYEELIKLDELRQRGILTEEEFNLEKAKILKAPR
jgi:hypothetical protein